MRGYFFSNCYLSSTQHGIQAAHCIADMFIKYATKSVERDILYEWATNHKTMIVVNGGNHSNLNALYLHIRALASELKLPYEIFKESGDCLNYTTTCVGIIVPEKIYIVAKQICNNSSNQQTDVQQLNYFEYELAKIISQSRLA